MESKGRRIIDIDKKKTIEQVTKESVGDLQAMIKEHYSEIGTLIGKIDLYTQQASQDEMKKTFKELKQRLKICRDAVDCLHKHLKPINKSISIMDDILNAK